MISHLKIITKLRYNKEYHSTANTEDKIKIENKIKVSIASLNCPYELPLLWDLWDLPLKAFAILAPLRPLNTISWKFKRVYRNCNRTRECKYKYTIKAKSLPRFSRADLQLRKLLGE